MRTILANLVQLKGVHHAFIYTEGSQLISTFEESENERMTSASELIEQVFSALRAVNQAHDEIYFSCADRFS